MFFKKKQTKNSSQGETNTISYLQQIIEDCAHPTNGKSLKSNSVSFEISEFKIKDEDGFHINFEGTFSRQEQIQLEAQIRISLSKLKFPKKIKIAFKQTVNESPDTQKASTPPSNPHPPPQSRPTPNIKHIIAVASGKGGVGKSTVSVNLASSLANKGYKVGLLDADIYGPSIGKLTGLEGKLDLGVNDNKITPIHKYNMQIISFSFLVEQNQAIIWRGPMLGKALEQFIFDISWGELDYLVIDLPPGTGDVQLSLAQLVKVNSVVMVTTPQKVATQDALRSIKMFEQVKIPIIGIVENMSEFICPHCNEGSHIFINNGIEGIKSTYPILTQIPLTMTLMESCENGEPAVFNNKDDRITASFNSIVEKLESVS